MFRNRWCFASGHLLVPVLLIIDMIGNPLMISHVSAVVACILWSVFLALFDNRPKETPLYRRRSASLKVYMIVDLLLLLFLETTVQGTQYELVWLYHSIILVYAMEFGMKAALTFSGLLFLMSIPMQWDAYGGDWNRFVKGSALLLTVQAMLAAVIGNVADKLHKLAYYDSLTMIPNRMHMKEMLQETLRAAEAANDRIAVFFLDLDRFKNLNDAMGHDAGDELLRQTVRRLSDKLPGEVTLGRLGGDEFIAFLPRLYSEEQALSIGEDIVGAFREPFRIDGKTLQISTSVGISVYPEHGSDVSTLMKHADAAMYSAKIHKNRCDIFHNASLQALQEKFGLETDLAQALENGELLLHYQPKIDIHTGQMAGMEVLLRWKHPEKGMISPAEFIPIAEEQGYIIPIGEWVLSTACRQAKLWSDAGIYNGSVSVNLSVNQFYEPGFLEKLERVLSETGLPPHCLDLEITESMAMRNSDYTVHLLQSLNRLGVTISIDDFGTGYSSLSYLALYPIHSLKIDKSFVSDMGVSQSHAKIVKSIVYMANSLKLRTVAEGVETWEQFQELKHQGCLEAQGYLFSKPVTADEMERILASKRFKPETKSSGSGVGVSVSVKAAN